MDLADKYRPNTLGDVVGQALACSSVAGWMKSSFPHALLFTGPSGCGKTTLARIVSGHLGCPPEPKNSNFVELNAADARGIDTVREVSRASHYRPIGGGKSRVWLVDECHRLTKDAQSALLKLLEDFARRKHSYFMLATTDPSGLLPTIKTRCSEVRVTPLGDAAVRKLVATVAKREGIRAPDKALDLITETACGSARKALVLLGGLRGVQPGEMCDAIQKSEARTAAFDLVKILIPFQGKPSWDAARKVLVGLENEDPEQLRQMVLKCAHTTLLKGGATSKQAAYVIECFEANFYGGDNAARALLARAVYNSCLTGG